MSLENDLVSCSVRIPEKICRQIDAQARVTRRSRNAQIIQLLEIALDIQAARDAKLLAEMIALRDSAS